MTRLAMFAFLLMVVFTIPSAQAQPPVYREIDMDGQAWTDTNYVNLRQWILRRNQQIADERAVAYANWLRAEQGSLSENPPTGVIAEKMPDVRGNWYGGAPADKVIGEVSAESKKGFSLACFGPNAETTVKAWKSDPRFQSAANGFGSSLHIQAYSDKDNYAEIESVAPGITAGRRPGVVLSLIDKDNPDDGKVLWRPIRDPTVEEVVAQLRDKQRPDYDPSKDPSCLPSGPLSIEALKSSPIAKLGAVFLGILAIARFRR